MLLKTLVERYLKYVRTTRAKSLPTIRKEACCLEGWVRAYGDSGISQLTKADLSEYAMNRAESVSNRTINLDMLILGNALKFAVDQGSVASVVTDSWKPLKHTTPLRTLIPGNALEKLCTAALARGTDGQPIHPNGQFLVDFLKLLAYSGCRRQAGLSARWEDVNFETKIIAFRTKFDKTVQLNFNPALEAHLKDLYARKLPKKNAESVDWIFPTEEGMYERANGKLAEHPSNPSRLFNVVREMAGLPDVTFHDFRHAFASKCVMAGIDFMTVARFLGHSDGGILVAKVYGHLSNTHLRETAEKLKL